MCSALTELKVDYNNEEMLFLVETLYNVPKELRTLYTSIAFGFGYDREKSTGVFKKYTGGIIIIDNNYKDLSEVAQRFTINHEIGHVIIPGGLPKTQEEYNSSPLRYEEVADMYACSIVGHEDAVKAINEIYEFMTRFRNEIPWDEYNKIIDDLKERIKLIEKM